jgi:hypothetical protein
VSPTPLCGNAQAYRTNRVKTLVLEMVLCLPVHQPKCEIHSHFLEHGQMDPGLRKGFKQPGLCQRPEIAAREDPLRMHHRWDRPAHGLRVLRGKGRVFWKFFA